MDAKQFIAQFGRIAKAPGGISRLRMLVIQLAVQGRLISQGGISDSVTELFESVCRKKATIIAEKKLPREKPYPSIAINELPIDRPDSWLWPRFGEVWQLLSGRDLAKSQYNESRLGIPYITGASNIENGVIEINRWTENPVVISTTNDLLVTCKGTIGAIAINNIGDLHIARQIMAIRDFSGELNLNYLKIWLESYVAELKEKSKSMIPGFSPLAPEQELLAASRLFLEEIKQCVTKKQDFAFETTLSGKSYLKLIRQLQAEGWRIELIYLALPSAELSKKRVAERVAHGGHNISARDIERRFPRSLNNLLNHFSPLVDHCECYLNAADEPVLIFEQQGQARTIHHTTLFASLEEAANA